MKRALFLAYEFSRGAPPGAALRSRKLAHHLPQFGWNVSVICRQESGPAAETADVLTVLTPVWPNLSYQLAAWSWARRILPAARAFIRDKRPDVIYASCPPFGHSLSALRLAREADVPVVVDFRDAWSLDPFFGGGTFKGLAKRALCRSLYPRLERQVFDCADAVITNTPSMRQSYERLYPRAAGRIRFVPNGFDEDDFVEAADRPSRSRPLVLYCGRFSEVGERSPELLLSAVRKLVDSGRDIQLDILGDDSVMVQGWIRRLNLAEFARARAAVAHGEAVRSMRQADVLVVCQSQGRGAITPVAGKTYEYLRTGLPILALVPPGDNADLIRRYAQHTAVVAEGDPALVASALAGLLDDAAAANAWAPDPGFLAQYSRSGIARQVAGVLDDIVSPRRT